MSDWGPFSALDPVIHQPIRLMIVTILASVAEADFTYLLRETGATKGNLSSHLARLESSGLVEIEKTFRGRTPLTLCRLTRRGRPRLLEYLDALREVSTRASAATRRRSRV
jgi:DNA-binding transcriptional ArsR family regulator